MPGAAMIVVDASVWVARLVSQDAFHQPVRIWMAARRSENILLISPSILLAEVAGAISRRTGSPELAEQTMVRLQNLPGLRLIEMERTLVESAARFAGQLGLRCADALYVSAAEMLGLPLCTLDEDQAHRAAYLVDIQFIPTR